jgi:hypothetical protein
MGAIKIKGETSGSTTIVAPATGSDVTMTLPGSSLDLGAELASKLPIAGGKILQIVRATDSTNRTTTSTSFVDVTGMSVTITPQKTDSAILLVFVFGAQASRGSSNLAIGYYRLVDSSNNAISGAQDAKFGAQAASTTNFNIFAPLVLKAWVAPAGGSAVTYKLQFKSVDASTTTYSNNDEMTGQMYAIEVSA